MFELSIQAHSWGNHPGGAKRACTITLGARILPEYRASRSEILLRGGRGKIMPEF